MSRIATFLIPLLCTGTALAQSSTIQTAAAPALSSPVAYVYVSTYDPTNSVVALAASPDGSLTYVGAAPSPQPITALSVTKKFLFGTGNNLNIFSYSIAPSGAPQYLATTDAGIYLSDPSSYFYSEILQVDETGSDLYAFAADSKDNLYLLSFKIEDDGELKFLGSTYWTGNLLQIQFVQNNEYAVSTGCVITDPRPYQPVIYPETLVYKRESSGLLSYIGESDIDPVAESQHEYCAEGGASDSRDHLAVFFENIDPAKNSLVEYALGAYSVSPQGKVTTKSDYKNMPSLGAPLVGITPNEISISPSGEILAVGGLEGYQFFHFNGANPITKESGVIGLKHNWPQALAWDKSNHLYILTLDSVIPYSITPASYKKHTPYSFSVPHPYSIIVLSVK
jgi:hypothetical protein